MEMLCAGGVPYQVQIPIDCNGTVVGAIVYTNLVTGVSSTTAPVGLGPCTSPVSYSGIIGATKVANSETVLDLYALDSHNRIVIPDTAIEFGSAFAGTGVVGDPIDIDTNFVLSSLIDVDPALSTDMVVVVDATTDPFNPYAKLVPSSTFGGVAPIPLTYLDTTTTLAADSDTKVASQKATKAYVDAADTRGKFEYMMVALGNETTATTTGQKVSMRMPFAWTVSGYRLNATTAASSGTVTVDIKKNGTSVFSTLLTLDATEATSLTAATPAVISGSTTSWADDDVLTAHVTVAGTASAGLKVTLIGSR